MENEEKLNDAASGSSGGDQGSSNRQLTMVSFLKPVLKQIIMAGKSMQLLRNLDSKDSEQLQRSCRGQCFCVFFVDHSFHYFHWSCCITDADRKSLYTLFLESVQSRLCSQEESPVDTITQQQATTRSLIKMQSIIAQHLEIDNIHDPLLAINFARWTTLKTFKWNIYVFLNPF